MQTSANSEEPDEMTNNVAFMQGLHWLLRQKQSSNEPQHEISNNVVYATSKASDQSVHMCSPIRAFNLLVAGIFYEC